MSSASLILIIALSAALGAWIAVLCILTRPLLPSSRRREEGQFAEAAEVSDYKRRSDQAEAVWRYVAEHHAFDPATDLCLCGGRYLLCPGRAALYEYANHLLAPAENSAPAAPVVSA
jgi:hypothetical protein